VAEELLNPFGEDDDNFEINALIDSLIKVYTYDFVTLVLLRYCYGKLSHLSVCLSVRLSVCLSVTLRYRDHMHRLWNSSKIMSRLVRLGVFALCRPRHHGSIPRGNHQKFRLE